MAFIPWENVLIHRDVEKTKGFYTQSGFFNRYNLQAAIRLTIKLEFCVGLLMNGTDATGVSSYRGIQAEFGELVAMRELQWGLCSLMGLDTEPGTGNSVVSKLQIATANRLTMTNAWQRVHTMFETVLAGAPLYTVSSVKDMKYPELRHFIDQYFRVTGIDAGEGFKLFELVWDAICSEFAGRYSLYKRNYAGNQDQQRIDTLNWCQVRGDGDAQRYQDLVDQCLNDYDLDGWCDKYLA